MPEQLTRDKVVFKGARIEWENGSPARIVADYTKMSAAREIPVDRSRTIPLSGSRQSQLDMIRDMIVSFILNAEESTQL